MTCPRPTLRRVVEAVNPNKLRAALDASRGDIVDDLAKNHVIIDGKKLRGENPTSRGCNGLYILNAWVSEAEICVGEERVDDKTNELAVLPALLASLWLTGSLVSVDDMGTHRNIAQQIIMQGGDCLMPVKDNQRMLKELVDSVFGPSEKLSSHTLEETGHGRAEKRECVVIDTRLLEQEGLYQEWPGLKRTVKVNRERTEKGLTTKETIYIISAARR